MHSIDHRPRRAGGRRWMRRTAVVVIAACTAIAPSTVSAAPALSFGTVSVGAVKTLNRTVPLEYALSDLPAGTVIYAGGNPTLDFGLAALNLSVPLTNTEVINERGDVSATYHVTASLATATDFDVDAPGCASATGSCTADVTFQPTATGARTDTITWQMSDVQVAGGGSLGDLLQALAPLVADSFTSQLAIAVDGIGVPATDSVSARVDIAASAACIELNTSSIDFGSSTLGAENLAASPTITVTNCSGVGETLYARGTDATGPSSAWSLVDSAATCATDLGLDSYRLGLGLVDLSVVGLSTLNKTLQSLAPGEDADQVARIWTACPGSTGAGIVMTMQIHYLVTSE